ncbi:MAG TPA: hypothetical protein VLJ37_04545 [bacterium]|nr:hypothetical protein [bacterium]
MKRTPHILLMAAALLSFGSVGCSVFQEDGGGVTKGERDVSGKLSVALGGSAPGLETIVIDEPFTALEFENNDPDLFDLRVDGNSARILPRASGIGYVTPVVNGRARDPIEITIPPQRLIQILIGEARGELVREATTEPVAGGEVVTPGSVSVTGDAVAATIRNRINTINDGGRPSLFLADATDYESDPPLSYYDAVIEATNGSVYQFSPVQPGDPSHSVYLDAEAREDVDEELLIAYDQAALTAAAVFNGETEDPTGGAFAFYSPTPTQAALIQDALATGVKDLPAGCGTSDANFPALAPVQVLLLKDVAPSTAGQDIPSFVFVRSRADFEPAVVLE